VHAVVIYESMFGNTRAVAEAIGEGLAAQGMAVEIQEVGHAPLTPDPRIDLLVVGGPTHAFGMSRESTRASAAEQAHGPLVSTGIGIREWLEGLGPASAHAAAFDTHVDKRVPGSAARAAQRRLRGLGYRIVAPAQSFFVTDVEGPLAEGERERARRWGEQVAESAGAPGRTIHPV
jgi:flavodoxin